MTVEQDLFIFNEGLANSGEGFLSTYSIQHLTLSFIYYHITLF